MVLVLVLVHVLVVGDMVLVVVECLIILKE